MPAARSYDREVGVEPELEVGVDGVGAVILQLIGADLVAQADPAALLDQVDHDAPALAADPGERRIELRPAVAAQAAEHLAGEARAVDPGQHVVAAHVPEHHRDVLLGAGADRRRSGARYLPGPVDHDAELAV